jgi:putative transport protein
VTPLLAVFLVAAIGYLAGKVQIGGVSLGVAAVLFAGLAISAMVPDLMIPELVPQLGLVIFIYAIGIASGPGFFQSFRRRGLRDAALTLGIIVFAASSSALLGHLLGTSAETTAGLFAGALTNTPALAAVVQSLERSGGDTAAPVVAYSVAYPLGVLCLLLAMLIAQRFARKDVTRPSMLGLETESARLETATVRIDAKAQGATLSELQKKHGLRVAFGRLKRDASLRVADPALPLIEGDLVSLIGAEDACLRAVSLLGEKSEEHLELDRHVLDFRRISVSKPELVERPLSELALGTRFGATITRIRRGDVELLPTPETELELGDRVRVIAPRERMDEVSRYFGDSARAVAEIDTLTFGLGIVLGLLLGEIPVPLPGGTVFRLGIAGGPLVVALILGHFGRIGPLVFGLPFAASLTLRQVGLLLFLGGVGLRSGGAFAASVAAGRGLEVLFAGAVITFVVALSTLLLLNRVLRLPIELALGMVSGIHTQPAALAFASERSGSDLPRIGYASVFPIATVGKIVIAQLLSSLLS